MSRIILINPDYYKDIFVKSKVRSAISRGTVPLGLLSLAGPLLNGGHQVKIVNLNLENNPDYYLEKVIRDFRPEVAGITSTTPIIKKAYQIASAINKCDEKILIIAGGPHPSAVPKEVLKESKIDCVVRGEGDLVLKMIVDEGISKSVPNITYKDNGTIICSEIQNHYIKDLDALPFPPYELLDLKRYYQPSLSSRAGPVCYIETSRGCYGKCIYCNKNIHGYKVRQKTPLRVVEEMEKVIRLGFKEIHIIDDIFTANMDRAYAICDMILSRGLKFPWYPRGGIRVDRVNIDLLRIMKKAGCYRIPFGIESGSQRVLDVAKKGITLGQAERAVKLAKEAGLETECYFMLGLPTETERDLQKSIDFAIKLDPDYAKFAICIPLPGTVLFEEMAANGQIKSTDWDKYNFAISPKELYDHDTLPWHVIDRNYVVSHRKFYFRFRYIWRMLLKTAANGTIFGHMKAFLKTRW